MATHADLKPEHDLCHEKNGPLQPEKKKNNAFVEEFHLIFLNVDSNMDSTIHTNSLTVQHLNYIQYISIHHVYNIY